MYLCKFGQNPSTGSKDITSERSYADADGIRTKNNMSPAFGWGDIIVIKYKFFIHNGRELTFVPAVLERQCFLLDFGHPGQT